MDLGKATSVLGCVFKRERKERRKGFRSVKASGTAELEKDRKSVV